MTDNKSKEKKELTVGQKTLVLVGMVIPWIILFLFIYFFPAVQTVSAISGGAIFAFIGSIVAGAALDW